ncbi:MAG: hypothetical protein ACLR8Y_10200 [Alistipes indistinctus]
MIVELRTEQDSVLSIGFLSRRPPDPLLEKLSEQEAKYRVRRERNGLIKEINDPNDEPERFFRFSQTGKAPPQGHP